MDATALKIVIVMALGLFSARLSAAEKPYVVFLGTGAADIHSPDSCRCSNCTYIRDHGHRNPRRFSSLYVAPGLVIDFSTTGMSGLAAVGIAPTDIKCLLITHSHGDHFDAPSIVRLADERAKKTTEPLPVFGNSTVTAALKKHIASLKRAVPVTPTEVTPYRDFAACGWTCTPVLANHDPNEQCLFYVLSKGDLGILYATDTTWFPAKTFQTIGRKKLDLAIVEGTFGPLTDPAYLVGHMNFAFDRLVRKWLRDVKVLKPGGTFALTHLSLHWVPPYDLIVEPMAKEGILVSYDGLKIPIGK
jgi:phosphoribosyl 1,2-cyclic phosphate phosphodiesterase